MSDRFTSQTFWENYWKHYRFKPVSANPVHKAYIPSLSPSDQFMEIGGFPGLNAAYIYKYCRCKHVTLLDFYIDRSVIARVEEKNDLPAGTIQAIEADFFHFETDKRYDLVFSSGFIEHFEDTQDVVRRHYDLVADGGSMLIVLPNFRGLNGWIQQLFDKENLKAHNLKSMDIRLLRSICRSLNLKDIRVEYTRKPMVWLEPKPGFGYKTGRPIVKALSYFLKLFPVKCRLLSPYIVLFGRKQV